ncbi:MAG: ATP-binding protein, partial [Allosphingosinicella sp.]
RHLAVGGADGKQAGGPAGDVGQVDRLAGRREVRPFDRLQIDQIVVNLLTNAIRYSPEDGHIWVRTDREGDLAALIIADQGKGISAEDQGRIFEKFERVDQNEAGGTGLGLYIARRLARAMGGDVAVDSAPGPGARFTFTLPLRRE